VPQLRSSSVVSGEAWDWSLRVFDHVDLHASDYAESVRFYETVLAALGIPRVAEGDDWTCFTNRNVADRRRRRKTSISASTRARRSTSTRFIAQASTPAFAQTASPATGTTPRATTPRTCSTPTGTTWRPSTATSATSATRRPWASGDIPALWPSRPRVVQPASLSSGLWANSFQCPSEMISTVSSTILMAVSSSIAYAGFGIATAHCSAAAIVFSGRST
jgi:hypothetical protein